MEFRVLNNGSFTLDKSFIVYSKYQGTIYEAALKPMLMLTEKVLIDTGYREAATVTSTIS